MRIDDAIRHAKKLSATKLTGADKVAVHCLIEFAARVVRTRKSIHDLAKAVSEEDLNQESMFR